ncbi:MAG: hypothetical protein ACRC16_22080 [Aeromonas salmonicida]
MSFGFDCETSGDAYRSLKGLVNSNNGVWKSRKQREFLLNGSRSPLKSLTCTHSVEALPQGTRRIRINAHVRQGHRTFVPVRWDFLVDEIGVARLSRVRAKGTEVLWSRDDAQVETTHLEESQEEKDAREAQERAVLKTVFRSQHQGKVGDRIEVSITVKRSIRCDGDYGPYHLNFLEDGRGNVYMVSGRKLGEDGEQMGIRGTVKAHTRGRAGEAITRLNRPHQLKDAG